MLFKVTVQALFLSQGGEAPEKLLTAPKGVGIELARYWPDARGLLFWYDPMHSASLAADGLGLYSLPLAGGSPRYLATTLPYRSWVQPNGRSILLIAGTTRIAWAGKRPVDELVNYKPPANPRVGPYGPPPMNP